MDKLKMQTVNKADENFSRKFPARLLTAMRNAISLLGRTRRSPFFLPMPRSTRPCVPAVRKALTLTILQTSILRAIIWKC